MLTALLTLLLPTVNAAGICCTATGGDPLALRDCEGLALITGAEIAADADTATLTPNFGVMGRANPWLVLGLRVPVIVEASDAELDWGVGHLYPWARFDKRLNANTIGAWFMAAGSVGPDSQISPGAVRIETGPSIAWADGDRLYAARVIAKAPIVGTGESEARLELAAGRTVGRTQLGLRGSASAAGVDAVQTMQLTAGPAAWLTAGPQGRVALSLTAGPRMVEDITGWTAGLSAAWLAPL